MRERVGLYSPSLDYMACPFCNIISKEAPAHIVARQKRVIAFMDINPVSVGHALVVPRAHEERWTRLDSEDDATAMTCAQQVGRAVQKAFDDVAGVNLLATEGEAAGQEVLHAHIHVIPRRAGDGVRFKMPSNADMGTVENLKESAKRIQTNMDLNK